MNGSVGDDDVSFERSVVVRGAFSAEHGTGFAGPSDVYWRGPYKELLALTIVDSIRLITFAWRAAEHSFFYAQPDWGRAVNMTAMLFVLTLFPGASLKTSIKRCLRHAQLTSVLLWSVGHFLADGDSRSVIPFGAMALG